MKRDVKSLVLAALAAALLAVFSQLMVPLPPVPINLALLMVLLAGFILPSFWPLVSVGLFLLMGLIGLPVFAGFKGGPQALFGPTGGYLLGYLFSALCVLLLRRRTQTLVGRLAVCALAVLACYIPGTLWLMAVTDLSLAQALPLAVLPFLPGDALKCLAAALLAPRLQAAFKAR